MRILVAIFCAAIALPIAAQEGSTYTLSGQILDKGTNISLPFSTIYIEDLKTGTTADENGFFELKGLYAGAYHLEFTHIGCEPESQYFQLIQDTLIQVYLHHHEEFLDEIVVHGEHSDNSSQVSNSISQEAIRKASDKNLSDILEGVAGVSVLKNGAGISKPVVHGLYGNRVAVLNNGISQAGQQWGNDHAPEIDPYVADHLSVVKGASALAYSSNALGSVILVEAGEIDDDPHVQGNVNYIYQTNGRGHTLNGQISNNSPWAAWRITGTLKQQGDSHTPNHFLTNTGKKEGNIALQIDKSWTTALQTEVYYSLFNTEIGVLRGSHIGNLTDLNAAFERDEPFFTAEEFSYAIAAPRQAVQHHLLKVKANYFLSEKQVLRFQYGGQLNNRKEYDVRRSGRTDIPSLSLNQFVHFVEGNYQQQFASDVLLKTGLQFNFIDNANEPGTGISPLIPRYKSYTPAAFLIVQKEQNDWFYEVGGRYDFKQLNVTTFTQSLPREIEYPKHQFHNYAVSAGVKYQWSENLKTSANIGYMLRAPEVNELYSSGLHQGVSGIEEGRRDLSQEKSLKALVSTDFYWKKKWLVQGVGYYQRIADYIYLQPQDEFRLTIRGAFPVFLYEQADATIYGTDWQLTYAPLEALKITTKYALVRGINEAQNLPLINLPSDNISTTINYSFADNARLKQSYIALNGKYVWQQSRLTEAQDFLSPPDAYFLLGGAIGTTIDLEHSALEVSFSVENALNSTYRDYLNRLRYFSDEVGVNYRLRVNYLFGK